MTKQRGFTLPTSQIRAANQADGYKQTLTDRARDAAREASNDAPLGPAAKLQNGTTPRAHADKGHRHGATSYISSELRGTLYPQPKAKQQHRSLSASFSVCRPNLNHKKSCGPHKHPSEPQTTPAKKGAPYKKTKFQCWVPSWGGCILPKGIKDSQARHCIAGPAAPPKFGPATFSYEGVHPSGSSGPVCRSDLRPFVGGDRGGRGGSGLVVAALGKCVAREGNR